MTIERQLRMLGVREARATLRPLVEQVAAGTPIGVLVHSHPTAVMLHPDEADRWERIERSLAALHSADVYPELAANTSQIGSLVRSSVAPSLTALRRLARQHRQILSAPEYLSLDEARARFGSARDRVGSGRPIMLVSYSRPVALLIGFDEYRRLTELSRTVSWFAAAGLDLARATPDEVIAWLTDYRSSRTRRTDDAAEASA